LNGGSYHTASENCTSDRQHGDGRGQDHGHGRLGHCSGTTITGSMGTWGVHWIGDNDDDCSSTTTNPLTTSTLPSSVSATTTESATGTTALSLGATVVTTVSGRTLTGTVFTAAAASGTVAAAQVGGGVGSKESVSAFGAIIVALVAAICML
jgi:hypothetical protein